MYAICISGYHLKLFYWIVNKEVPVKTHSSDEPAFEIIEYVFFLLSDKQMYVLF